VTSLAGAVIVESGSNANGEFIKFADGTLICKAMITAVFYNTAVLTAAWVYPCAFTGETRISATIGDNLADATPTLNEVGGLHISGAGVNSATLRIPRISGLTAFVSGDTSQVHAITIGSWK
jgi:hypothetical protein